MHTSTITYPSADGTSTARALLWEPDDVAAGAAAPRALVQIVHGMSEHVERYAGFAEFLVDHGFAVCAEDHIGHGKTARAAEDLGHMPLGRGEDILLTDVQALRLQVAVRWRQRVPYVAFGHSMGSFITRVYLTRYAFGSHAVVLCGTGQQPRSLAAAGKALTWALARVHGDRYRSRLVDGMGAGAYGKAIEGARTEVDWISTDARVVDEYLRDPLCGQTFTVGAYHTLASLVSDAQAPRLTARIPKALPMLFIAGDGDPVGEFGRGVHRAVEQYRAAGIERVDEIIYPGARHELLNEFVRDRVQADVLAWLEGRGL